MAWIRAAYRRAMGWYHASLLPRFVLSIALAGILFVVTAFLFIRLYFYPAMIDSVRRVETAYLEMQAGNIRNHMRACRDLVFECVIDSNILRHAIVYQASAIDDRAYAIQQIHRAMRGYLTQRSDVIAYTVYMPDGTYIYYSRLTDRVLGYGWFSWTMGGGYNAELVSLCTRASESDAMQIGVIPGSESIDGMRFFHLAYPLKNLYSHRQYGVVVLSFNALELNDLVNPEGGPEQSGGASYGLLLDADQTILAYPDAQAIGRRVSNAEADDALRLPDELILLEKPLDILDLTLMRGVDRSRLLADADRMTQSMMLLFAAITALFVLVVSGMMQRIIRSIRQLRNGLDQVEAGNLETSIRTRQVNEIGQIVASFNAMTARLKQVSQERETESRRAIRALNHLRVAEIRALENQINSHFLYNTLGAISYTAIRAGNHCISNQIGHLSKMLRYIFERSDGVVPLQKEAEWLNDYLELQRLRYGRAMDYRVAINPLVAHWPTHKLILQPFVENSLIHGFDGRTYGGLIEVKAEPFDDRRIRISVRDNGRGMKKEQAELLNKAFAAQHMQSPAGGIGIDNAALRIYCYYRGGAKVWIRSWEGVGTLVVLLLPKATAT
jgi:two-component system sensor histidine kinase YesM